VIVQTYIAKLKEIIKDLEESERAPSDHDHAHYHGHERCTHDHSHSHSHGEEESLEEESLEEESQPIEDIPEWKKNAMDVDPSAAPFGGSWTSQSEVSASEDDPLLPPLYKDLPEDDYDKASELKSQAADLKSAGDFEEALSKFNLAVLAAQPSALLYANRADTLLRLQRPRHAVRDCDEALKLNPDSAKALRIRGLAKKEMGEYEGALRDLSEAQTIDYSDDVVQDLKFCTEKHMEAEKAKAEKRLQQEEKLKKKYNDIKKAKEDAQNDDAPPTPTPAGIPPGMAGLMQALMSDPELAAGMQNPKVMKAFQDLMTAPGGAMALMSNPAKLQQLMTDPDVGPFMQKLVNKLGPMMMGGAGMPPFARPSHATAHAGDMPDIPDISKEDDIDDMPDLD